MQTPKARSSPSRKVSPRASSSEVPRKASPQAISVEVSPKISPRGPQKVSPRVVRQLNKTIAQDFESTFRTTKVNSPRITERRTPPSPLYEKPRNKVVELESQISRLECDLEKVKNQLISSESWRKQSQQNAKNLQEQLLAMSQKQLSCVVEEAQTIKADEVHRELNNLKEKLDETLKLMDDVNNQLRDCKESEAQKLMQLETANTRIEMLILDNIKSNEAYDAIASELAQSRTCVKELVNKLKAVEENGKRSWEDSNSNELQSLKFEVEQLRSALVTAEIRYNKEQTRSQREKELEVELKKSQTMIQELKADMMDKETELQGICEENEFLNIKLKDFLSGHREFDLQKELEKSMANIEILKANLMDKETELQNISEENETLKMERFKRGGKVGIEVEAAKVAETEALMKGDYMSEYIDTSNKKVNRAFEQLKAAQEANSELEAELRMLKVQANQWRKAAETAAAMLSSGNNGKIMNRTGSTNNHYNTNTENINLSYSEDVDEDLLRRKNTNMLRKIGVFRRKSQK